MTPPLLHTSSFSPKPGRDKDIREDDEKAEGDMHDREELAGEIVEDDEAGKARDE